jgi:hypothetical protein
VVERLAPCLRSAPSLARAAAAVLASGAGSLPMPFSVGRSLSSTTIAMRSPRWTSSSLLSWRSAVSTTSPWGRGHPRAGRWRGGPIEKPTSWGAARDRRAAAPMRLAPGGVGRAPVTAPRPPCYGQSSAAKLSLATRRCRPPSSVRRSSATRRHARCCEMAKGSSAFWAVLARAAKRASVRRAQRPARSRGRRRIRWH